MALSYIIIATSNCRSLAADAIRRALSRLAAIEVSVTSAMALNPALQIERHLRPMRLAAWRGLDQRIQALDRWIISQLH